MQQYSNRYRMDFTVSDLHKKEKDCRSLLDKILFDTNNAKNAVKTESVEALSHSALMKMNKDQLANFVESLSKSLVSSIELSKSAAGTIDELRSEKIVYQQQQIDQQKEQLTSVQQTVQTEIQSWTDIVKKNCQSNAPSYKKIQKVVQSAVRDDARSRNFIIHGASECYSQDPVGAADVLLNEIWQHLDPPAILAANFLGTKKPESGRSRPVKVTLDSNESVKMVLAKAPNLKKTNDYRTWYITPDRTPEEQAAHKKLVAQLKDKITADSTMYHYIKDGKVMSVVKK